MTSSGLLIEELRDVLEYNWSGTGLVQSEVRLLLDRITSLEAALAEAHEALKPFAKAEISREAKDWERIAGWSAADRITFADLRRAARASTSIVPLDGGEGNG